MAPDLKAMSRPAARLLVCGLGGAGHWRAPIHALPIEAGIAPDSTAPMRKPTARRPGEQPPGQHEDHCANHGDGRVLPCQISLGRPPGSRPRFPACVHCPDRAAGTDRVGPKMA